MSSTRIPFLPLFKKVLQICRVVPAELSGRLAFSILFVILIPLLDLLMAFSLYAVLIVLQGGAVSFSRLTFMQDDIGLVIMIFILVFLGRQIVEFLSIKESRGLTQNIYKAFAMKLIDKYHSLTWLDYTKEAKAIRIKHCTATSLNAAYSFQVVLNLLGSFSTLLLLSSAIIVKMPTLAIVTLVSLSVFVYLSKKFIKRKIEKAVSSHEYYEKRFYQKLFESLSLFREIKVFNSYKFFYKEIESEIKEFSKAKEEMSVFTQVPRVTLDLILTLALSLGILVITKSRYFSATELIANLATIAVLSRRVITAMGSYVSTLTEIEGAFMNIMIIQDEFIKGTTSELYIKSLKTCQNILLRMEHISFSYSDDHEVLRGFSLDVMQGDRIAIMGETGRGKSTLLMIAAGFITPQEGEVLISDKLGDNQGKMAYVPQEVTLLSGSILDNVVFGDNKVDEELLEKVVRAAKLDAFIEGLPRGVHSSVGDNGVSLSGGQKQRIGIARALYRQPAILFLDEATSSLDEETELEVMKNINEFIGRGAVVFITHRKAAAVFHATRICKL